MKTARRLLRTLVLLPHRSSPSSSSSSSSITTLAPGSAELWKRGRDLSVPRPTLAAPWAAIQSRGAKVLGIDVLKAQHTQHGRGGASIQVLVKRPQFGLGFGKTATQEKPKRHDYFCSMLICYLNKEEESV